MNTIIDFYKKNDAERALKALEAIGVTADRISMVGRNLDMLEPKVHIYAFTAPEFGQVIATGALGDQLFTTLQTEVTSSLADAFVNTGFSKIEAEVLVEAVKSGDVLLSVE